MNLLGMFIMSSTILYVLTYAICSMHRVISVRMPTAAKYGIRRGVTWRRNSAYFIFWCTCFPVLCFSFFRKITMRFIIQKITNSVSQFLQSDLELLALSVNRTELKWRFHKTRNRTLEDLERLCIEECSRVPSGLYYIIGEEVAQSTKCRGANYCDACFCLVEIFIYFFFL